MDIKDFQNKVRNFTGEKFPSAPSYLALIKTFEESGELAGHFVKRIEHRVGSPEIDHQKGIEDAVGDIIISLCTFCCRENLDMNKIVEDTWDEVSKRTYIMVKETKHADN